MDRALQLFWEAAAGTRAQQITYTAVVSALESAGFRCEPCSSSMKCRSWDASPIHHLHSNGQCIGVCRMPERALQLFDEMRQQGLEPN